MAAGNQAYIARYVARLKVHRKSESVMVTPKKCKFLQLCEHQLSVKVTPTWCTFTPQ